MPFDWREWRGNVEDAARGAERESTAAEQAATLAARSLALAGSNVVADQSEESEFLLFELGGERYALEPAWVLGVARLQQLVRVPSAQAHVLGVTEWRGELLPVFSLRRLLEQSDPGLSDQRHLLVLGDERVAFGFLVDEVETIHTIRLDQVLGHRESRFTRGLTNDAVVVLDAGQLAEAMMEEAV